MCIAERGREREVERVCVCMREEINTSGCDGVKFKNS